MREAKEEVNEGKLDAERPLTVCGASYHIQRSEKHGGDGTMATERFHVWSMLEVDPNENQKLEISPRFGYSITNLERPAIIYILVN